MKFSRRYSSHFFYPEEFRWALSVMRSVVGVRNLFAEIVSSIPLGYGDTQNFTFFLKAVDKTGLFVYPISVPLWTISSAG